MAKNISRKEFLKATAMSAAGIGLLGAGVLNAKAEEEKPAHKNSSKWVLDSQNVKWDEEHDIVICGYGMAGTAAYIEAYEIDHNVDAVIYDKSDEANAGGQAIASGQCVIFVDPNDLETWRTYMRAMNEPHVIPEEDFNWLTNEFATDLPWIQAVLEPVDYEVGCSGGARRNIKGQVLNWDGEPIEGLYSAGEIGSLVCNLYQNGTYLHEAICSGRAAVDTMLGGRAELTPTFGCGAAAPWAEAADGDYSVMVQGLHDPFEVIYTIKDKQLVGIAVGEGRENMFMNDEQFAAFTKQIIETQDMGVDAVSGATVDCQAITGGIMTAFSHKTS